MILFFFLSNFYIEFRVFTWSIIFKVQKLQSHIARFYVSELQIKKSGIQILTRAEEIINSIMLNFIVKDNRLYIYKSYWYLIFSREWTEF